MKNISKRKIRLIFLIILLCTISYFIKTRHNNPKKEPIIHNKNTPNNEDSEKQGKTKPPTTKKELSWNLILVNKSHPLPHNFHHIELTQLKNGQSIDKRVYPNLQKMMNDARTEGLDPFICSSYRSFEKQTKLFNDEVNECLSKGFSKSEANEKASFWVAVPGTSEHELGLAVDIVSNSHQKLDDSQEKTPEQKWLMKNCHKYGFILRYPTNKSSITGIGYEPWHYRYVGKEVAKEIMEKGICLEEYLETIKN